MNTIHDLGGMDGFTLMQRDQDFPLHQEWERQIWGLALSLWAKEIPGYAGMSRAHIERIPPELYLSMPYYAKWLHALENALTSSGTVTREELANPTGRLSIAGPTGFVPATPAEVIDLLSGDLSSEVASQSDPRFGVGDEVLVRNEHPNGHTRVPRYTRGHRGVVQKHHGTHRLDDDYPVGEHPGPQHLYTVTFTARELWGSRGNANDRINAELWEVHLEPAS